MGEEAEGLLRELRFPFRAESEPREMETNTQGDLGPWNVHHKLNMSRNVFSPDPARESRLIYNQPENFI